jgi:hypothetical protein
VSYRRVTFEAELDVEGLPDGLAEDVDEDAAKQAVQDAIGHTGAVVTEILYVDAST